MRAQAVEPQLTQQHRYGELGPADHIGRGHDRRDNRPL